MTHLMEFVLGLLGKVLARELIAWSPKMAEKLIYYSVTKAPDELKERLSEEWHALLANTPGDLSKLARAISIFHGCARIRHEYHHPEIPYRPYSFRGRRILDILLGITFVLILAPMFLIISILVKVTSSGPVIIQVDKIHSFGYISKSYCFRTIYNDNSSHYKTTPIGKLLLLSSLDELPALFSVLKGDMSIIGA